MSSAELHWRTIDGKRFFKFTFHGHLTAKEAMPAIIQWRNEFQKEIPDGHKVNIIWDCLDMSGFDPNVKKTWQKTLKEHSNQIREIWIISTNPVIRVAALTMGLFSNYKIKTVVSELDIK
jgi:hypothetical protein